MSAQSLRLIVAFSCAVILFLNHSDGISKDSKPGFDVASQIPQSVTPPNRFGLNGDDAWLEAGQKKVPFAPRKRIIEIDGPGVLDQPDTEYRLTKDVVADGTAFQIVKNNITLNLNGHTVKYARNPSSTERYGVHLSKQWQFTDITVVNGAIIQAEPYAPGAMGDTWGIPYGAGSSPIFGRAVGNSEFAGLRLVYGGSDLTGLNVGGHGISIHHNSIEDKGSHVENRHRGVAAIEGAGAGSQAHHNVIVRARHNGIRIGGKIYNNIVNVDSSATNSAGISVGCSVVNNKIIGRGEHPLGMYAGGKCDGGIEYVGNYVDVQTTRRSGEYENAGAAGLRLQWGDKLRIADNTLVMHVDTSVNPQGWGRGIMVGLPEAGLSALFENNLIVALSSDGRAKAAGIAVVANNVSPNLIFRRNTVVSNWACVLLADSYGHADGFSRFEDNTFIKAKPSPDFKTVRGQYGPRPSTAILSGNHFEGGASIDDIELEFVADGLKELVFTRKAGIRTTYANGTPAARAKVTVADKTGKEVFSGETDAKGELSADVPSFLLSNRHRVGLERSAGALVGIQYWRVDLSPLQFKAEGDGKRSASASVTLNADTTVPLVLK